MLLNAGICDYARNMALDCDIDSSCVFISDKTTPSTRLYYLGNFGVHEEVLSQYDDGGICNHDPFTDIRLNETYAAADDRRFFVASDPHVAQCGARAAPYWQFVSHHDIDVIGASSLRLQKRLYLVIGAHRSRKKRYARSVPVERLAYRIETLQNRVAAHLLHSLLDNGRGYRTLVDVVTDSRAEPVAQAVELSPRETEISRLVCQGRQNKEIAWRTGLSEYTVENQLRRIYQKFGIHNRSALVARMNGSAF